MGMVGGIPVDELVGLLEDVSEMVGFGAMMIWERV